MELPVDSRLDESDSFLDISAATNNELADASVELKPCLSEESLGGSSSKDALHESGSEVQSISAWFSSEGQQVMSLPVSQTYYRLILNKVECSCWNEKEDPFAY